MVKKLLAAMVIVAIVFCIAGVIAEGGGDSGGGGGGSDSSSESSGSSDTSGSSSDNGSDSGADNSGTGKDGSSDRSGSSDTSGKSSSDNGSGTGAGSSASGKENSKDAAETEREHAAEVEVEHGIATIQSQETRHFSELTAEHAAKPEDSSRNSRNSAVVAVTGLASLASVPSPAAPVLAGHAKTIEDSLVHFSTAENAIQNRNAIITFIFGGDRSAAGDIEMHISEDSAALAAMDKVLDDPATSPALKEFTRQRETVIRAELERIGRVAEAEKQKKGLFG